MTERTVDSTLQALRLDANIGAKLKDLRHSHSITAEDAADCADMSIADYLACEAGQLRASASQIVKLAKLFGVGIGDIFISVTGDAPKD